MDPVIRNILEVALSEFAENGMAGARIDTIASRTSTSKRMLYYHFGSKEGLYAAVLDHAYRQVRGDDFNAERMAAAPALEALEELVGHAFDRHCAFPEFVRLVMYENLQGARVAATLTDVARLNRDGLEQVAQLLVRGQAEGSIRGDVSARDVYLLFIAQCFHFVSNRSSVTALLGSDESTTDDAHRRLAVIESVRRFVSPRSS